MRALIVALSAFAVVACGTDVPPELPKFVEVNGKQYPLEVHNCVVDVWDEMVEENNKHVEVWNKLTVERDSKGLENVTVDGIEYPDYKAYAAAQGWELLPNSWDVLFETDAVVAECGG